MELGELAKNAAKSVINAATAVLKKRLMIIGIIGGVFILILVSLFGAGDSSNSSSESGNTSGYSTVTTNAEMGVEYLMSWENDSIRQYILGKTSYTEDLKKLITEDKKYYICYTDYPNNDKGDRNFAYGVCHTPDLGKNYWHVKEYEKVGIDIDNGKYNEVGVSKISVSNVNDVFASLYAEKKVLIQSKFSGKGISENEVDALTAVFYQYGNIGNAVELYEKNGDFVKDFKVTSNRKRLLSI